ncbi:VWA domain-containing protein [Sulfurospirillum sp. UCH001]|uniref:vWA domain-containing protein n=1 Tax=Sulfurospirillum sp. UCH001 TaxID=1581011 RepID=UPI00082BFFDD|nr:VWA domain-containing protein [Sulfurospirillum sp. UCH001]
MSSLFFEYPFFSLIFVLFIISHLLLKSRNHAYYIPHIVHFSHVKKRGFFLTVIKWLSIALLCFALMSPYIERRQEPLNLSHTVMMLIDVSDSMNGTLSDSNVTQQSQSKFFLAKQLGMDYVNKQENSAIGLIVFGDFAYIASPLTYDKETVKTVLSSLTEGIAGQMTAMYDALFLGARLLQKNSAKEKAIILLTDGYNTAGKISLDVAFKQLLEQKIRVYTIGVGNTTEEYDKALLEEIATKSQGAFFEASNEQTLQNVFAHIDALEKSFQKSPAEQLKDQWFMYPLSVGFLLLLWYFWIVQREEI